MTGILVGTMMLGTVTPALAYIDPNTCNHHSFKNIQYSYTNNTFHTVDKDCGVCGTHISETEEHYLPSYYGSTTYERNNNESHYLVRKCYACNHDVKLEEKHNVLYYNYEACDDKYHYRVGTCSKCGETIKTKVEHSFTEVALNYKRFDKDNHLGIYCCTVCKAEKEVKEPHTYRRTYSYVYCNETSHAEKYSCICGEEKLGDLVNHSQGDPVVERETTIKTPGIIRYYCDVCNSTFRKTNSSINWYEAIDWSPVLKDSKGITFTLKGDFKGSILYVKIGKKTFKKKIGSSRKVKIKLKRSKKAGQKVKIQLKYQGTVVYSDDDIVYYSKNIKKGMTPKQVKLTVYWSEPDSTSSSSGGWKYWHYKDGSYIGFKNGHVRFWYDAAN